MDDGVDSEEQQVSEQLSVSRRSLTTFPFSKTTCVCNCGKYNLEDLPRLRKILPEDYEYKLCEYVPLDRDDKFLVTLRMALSTREEALEWKRRFEERSLTTHVKDKTFPKVERVSIFKAQYRCQFFDRRKTKKKLPEKSKFRDCHSILFMNIKKYFKNTVDRHMPAYQMVVRLHYAHNHPLDTADVLKKRHLNEDIKCRFLEMFRQGMKPKDALDKHKRELLENLGPEKYRQVVCDGYYVPNVPKAYRLYYQIHGKGVSAKTSTKRSSRHNPNPDWIAFQNFPDAVTADNDVGNECDGSDGEHADNGNEAAVVDEIGVVEQLHTQTTGSSCQNIADQPNNMTLTLEQSGRETIIPQDFPDPQSLCSSKPVVNGTVSHCMIPLDGQLQKTYSPYNPLYSNTREQHLPTQAIPVSSFRDPHLGMGLFNLVQPTWENFHTPNQKTVLPNGPQQHRLNSKSSDHQNSSASYMTLSNDDCQNTGAHFASRGIMDHSTVLQNQLSLTDLNINESNAAQNYPWAHIEPDYSLDILPTHSQETRPDQVLPLNHTPTQSQTGKKLSGKKTAQKQQQKKKKRAAREVNMKRVTKRWMDKKPKVEAETQNLASEVLQTILLADEAEKLQPRLLTFVSGLETKLTSNPKLFVPALKQFLQAAEEAESDCNLISYLKDFGKTEENVIKHLEAKRKESRKAKCTQTKLSGPVFKIGKAKPWGGNIKLSRENVKPNISISTHGTMAKLSSINNSVKNSNLSSRVKRTEKYKLPTESLPLAGEKLNFSDLISVSNSCLLGLKSGVDLNKKNAPNCVTRRANQAHPPICCNKQLKKSAARRLREIKDKQNISTPKHKKSCKPNTNNAPVPGNFNELLNLPGDLSHVSGPVTKNVDLSHVSGPVTKNLDLSHVSGPVTKNVDLSHVSGPVTKNLDLSHVSGPVTKNLDLSHVSVTKNLVVKFPRITRSKLKT